MLKMLWISVSVVLIVSIALIIVSFTNSKIETPKYKVLATYGDVEIRRYPKMVVAKTNLSEKSFDSEANNGFRTIASYIFGGNEKNEKIAMTAPVVMNMGDTASMYFVMPSSYEKESLPKPNSSAVQIVEESEKTLAVITYGGFSSDEKIEKHRKLLEKTLKEQNIETKGAYLYMGYNAPWDVLKRRNEVAVEISFE